MVSTYSALEARRETARQVFYKNMAVGDAVETKAITAAIETATRATITDELVDDLADVAFAGGFETRRALVCAALEALGFEVTE